MSEPRIFEKHPPHAELTFAQYLESMRQMTSAAAGVSIDQLEKTRHLHAAINYRRAIRIVSSYVPSPEIAAAAGSIASPQFWMVLTEPWCGDSAQAVPIIARIALCNPLLKLRLLSRDANPEIMDLYLTNGTRGIPKLVVFDNAGIELFRWGPRPLAGQAVFLVGAQEGVPKDKRLETLHLWYARNGGRAIEEELLAQIRQTLD